MIYIWFEWIEQPCHTKNQLVTLKSPIYLRNYRIITSNSMSHNQVHPTPSIEPVFQSLLLTNECTSDCLKNNIKIYIKIAPTCFSAVTPSSGSSLFVAAEVTLC